MRTFSLWNLLVFTLFARGNVVVSYSHVPLAANDDLLIFQTTVRFSPRDSIQYQCTIHGNQTFEIDFEFMPVDSISIGSEKTHSQHYFLLAGMVNESVVYMSKITVDCKQDTSSVLMQETVFFENDRMSPMIVSIDPHGRFAIGLTSTSLFFYDLVSLEHFSLNMTWPYARIFSPLAVDVRNNWIYVAGYSLRKAVTDEGTSVYADVMLYLLFLGENRTIQFCDQWAAEQVIDNPIMKLSLRVSTRNSQVLVGIPYLNTVHLFITDESSRRLIHVSSKMKLKNYAETGYGWHVDWLNNAQQVMIANVEFNGHTVLQRYSYVEYYDSNPFTNTTIPFAVFPNDEQNLPSFDGKRLLVLTSTTSVLYVMYADETISIIPASQPGYFSVEYMPIRNLAIRHPISLFVPNRVPCRPGTYKHNSGPWPCHWCQVSTANNSAPRVSVTCPQCTDQAFCPLELDMMTEPLLDIEQLNDYPESPEIDVFEGVLLRDMFRTECLRTSPLLFITIVVAIMFISSLVIGLMKFSKRFLAKQDHFTYVLRHLDLIQQGQLWFGGLISIALLVLLGFAVKFSYFYHYQYPIDSQHLRNQDTCQSNQHLNAKFDTNLQFLKKPFGQLEGIFQY